MSRHELRADFRTEVLEASSDTPVLVDFWAAWCGPCRLLGPVLEKLASEAGGAWKLVKVDTDAHPDLAQTYDIRGIPAVKLFSGGQPVAEFTGALPEDQVRAWLRTHLPRRSEAGVRDARRALEEGRTDEARSFLRESLAEDPEDHRARLLLARLLFLVDREAAAAEAARIPEDDPGHELARHLVQLEAYARWGRTPGNEDPSSDPGLYHRAARHVAEGDFEAALGLLIDLVGRNRALDEDGARRHAVALFAVLGDDHPVTRRFRPQLASAIY